MISARLILLLAKHCASIFWKMCEVYWVMLTCSILLVSPQYASKWWCRHAIALASACCHGCTRISAYAYAQTTVSNMNISCLEFSCSLCTVLFEDVWSIFSHPDLILWQSCLLYADTLPHAYMYIGMLSWSRAHAVMVACAYARKHMRIFHIFGRAKFPTVFFSIFVRGRILPAVPSCQVLCWNLMKIIVFHVVIDSIAGMITSHKQLL